MMSATNTIIRVDESEKHKQHDLGVRAYRAIKINGHQIEEWQTDEGKFICTINWQRSKLDYDETVAWVSSNTKRSEI